MIYVVMTIAYYAVLVLGLLALVALIGGAVLGVIYLYTMILEWYLAAKKLREIFRKFMVSTVMAEASAERKERE